jgi:rhamnulokinase
MPETAGFLTFDLGAESGRALLGRLANGTLELETLHRFANEPVREGSSLFWNSGNLFAEMRKGLKVCADKQGPRLDGIGVDTWGVDYGLLDERDQLVGEPFHYRDHRTDGVPEKAYLTVSPDELYARTGTQFMQINTVFQLVAEKLAGGRLDRARTLLFMPDLFHFWLTGRQANERTIASTSQFYDPNTGEIAVDMLERLGVRTDLFPGIVEPGTHLGPLKAEIAREAGLDSVPVIAPATHDTASAVAAVPADGSRTWAYISCGTWSLVGIESPSPIITGATREFNLTNEQGVNGTTRLLKNVMGLWLLQQARRSWEQHGSYFRYDQLADMAAREIPFRAFVDPDHPSFLNPTDMVASIEEFCRETGQRAPHGVGPIVRVIVESLAMKYRWVIERLEDVTGKRIETIHMIGGGTQNRRLCQATADATNRRVLAGPIEATAAGNVIVQAMSTGHIGSLPEGRALIGRSFPLEEYRPHRPEKWDAAYTKFAALIS